MVVVVVVVGSADKGARKAEKAELWLVPDSGGPQLVELGDLQKQIIWFRLR